MTREMTAGETVRAVVLGVVLIGATVVANVVAMRHVEHLSSVGSDPWLERWVIGTAAALALLSVVCGIAVLRATAPWNLALTLPLLTGPIVGISSYVTWSAMGLTDAHSAACEQAQACDVSFGFGAAALSVIASIGLGAAWLAGYGAKRFLTRPAGS